MEEDNVYDTVQEVAPESGAGLSTDIETNVSVGCSGASGQTNMEVSVRDAGTATQDLVARSVGTRTGQMGAMHNVVQADLASKKARLVREKAMELVQPALVKETGLTAVALMTAGGLVHDLTIQAKDDKEAWELTQRVRRWLENALTEVLDRAESQMK